MGSFRLVAGSRRFHRQLDFTESLVETASTLTTAYESVEIFQLFISICPLVLGRISPASLVFTALPVFTGLPLFHAIN